LSIIIASPAQKTTNDTAHENSMIPYGLQVMTILSLVPPWYLQLWTASSLSVGRRRLKSELI